MVLEIFLFWCPPEKENLYPVTPGMAKVPKHRELERKTDKKAKTPNSCRNTRGKSRRYHPRVFSKR
jgi:hypothetical protein